MIEVVLQAAMVPVITGVVQAIKTAGLPSRFAPLASICLGVLACVGLLQQEIAIEILQGVVVGLAASGLYSGAKAQFTEVKVDTL